ncbi:MAG: hypothetical protein ACTSRP_08625 [Candidatus Helarchaeota archaeon]
MSKLKIKEFNALTYEQVKLNVLANLFRMLVDIYGYPPAKKRLSKIEGEEIYVNFPHLKGGIIFKPFGERVVGTAVSDLPESEKPKARLNFKVKDEKIYDILEKIIKMKSSNWSFIKIFFKYILTGKIGLSVSRLGTLIVLFKCLMIGDHPMYKNVNLKKMGETISGGAE